MLFTSFVRRAYVKLVTGPAARTFTANNEFVSQVLVKLIKSPVTKPVPPMAILIWSVIEFPKNRKNYT